LGVEIGIGKAALPPVLKHDDVAIAGAEFGMELSAPTFGGEALALIRPNLGSYASTQHSRLLASGDAAR
jgi:hypothetical protein